MKCSAIQHENVQRGHFASIIATNVQDGIALHRHKLRNVVFICQMPRRQLSAICQTRLHSNTAAVFLSYV